MSREGFVVEKEGPAGRVRLEALALGEDWSVALTGGERPHIGAVALGVPYDKPDGGWSACVSVLTLPTHKEDALARLCADRLARAARHTVTVCCGIHTDALTKEGIAAFVALAEETIAAAEAQLKERQPRAEG